jgi:hypothetical protein
VNGSGNNSQGIPVSPSLQVVNQSVCFVKTLSQSESIFTSVKASYRHHNQCQQVPVDSVTLQMVLTNFGNCKAKYRNPTPATLGTAHLRPQAE